MISLIVNIVIGATKKIQDFGVIFKDWKVFYVKKIVIILLQ